MELRNYKKGDEYKILELFKLAFNKEMSIDYWNWRFKQNPFDSDFMIQLMWDNDKLVGHYAVSPVEMLIEGEIHNTALSMTTMTHPEYVGKGIFTKLSSSLYDELKNFYKYSMVWGFPNNNSHYGFIKNLNWKNISTIPMMSLKKSDLKLIKPKINFEVINSFNDIISKKLNLSSKSVKINKTKAYLNWRYINNPFANYKIISLENELGVIVYKVIQSFSDSQKFEIDIMEIVFNHDFEVLCFLLNAVILNENKDVIQFNIWSSIFSDDYLMLKKAGFISNLPITYLGFLNLEDRNLISEHYDRWDINFGYSDIF